MDLERVLAVYRQCEDFLALGPVPRASLQMVLADLAIAQQAGSIFYALYLPGNVMAGILDFLAEGYQGDSGQAYLALIMIAQPYRRGGLGKRLLDALETEVRQRGVHTFVAHVQINNPASLAFFQSRGFVITSKPQLQPDGTTSVELRKQL
jgi:ribosomal protein S18 acetylase RimI-like enzyme